jgi:hypothetical protein
MNQIVNDLDKMVYFEGKYPSVMGIPNIMKKYPEYTACVLSHDEFQQLNDKEKSL